LQLRARGFAIRDVFPDALRGVLTREEAEDTPPEPRHVENLASKPAAPPAPAPEPVEAPLPLVAPDAQEYALKGVETWRKAAMKALGMLGDDAGAIRAWYAANDMAFAAVAERYPDTEKAVRAVIDGRLDELAEPAAEEIAQ
jgi:hypothetical protein